MKRQKQTQAAREAQTDEQLHATSQQAALRQASESQRRKLENEYFLNELRKADIESDVFDWLEDEFPTWFSGAHAVSNRGDRWDEQADLMMMSKRERVYAESNPGRLLRDRPFLLATAQGAESPPLEAYLQNRIPGDREFWERELRDIGTEQYRAPMSSSERRVSYGAAEVAADLMSLSREGAGLDATTTATTETRVKRESEDETTASRLGTVFE